MHLQPHQQRVVDEKQSLDEKRGKLNAFLETATFHSLSYKQRYLLNRQSMLMDLYSEVLGERIQAFYA